MKHEKKPKTFTVNHFFNEGLSRQFIYRIIKMVEEGKSLEVKKRPGDKKIKLTKQQMVKLKKMCHGKVCPSLRQLGKKFNVSKDTMKKIL